MPTPTFNIPPINKPSDHHLLFLVIWKDVEAQFRDQVNLAVHKIALGHAWKPENRAEKRQVFSQSYADWARNAFLGTHEEFGQHKGGTEKWPPLKLDIHWVSSFLPSEVCA
ncbi:hypothetical protein [Pararhizobium sp. DWP1-1-3]|uniref:hypothetical protein n=1 Tax=Pararhizobium sp. DWP1-1-3 TaxID=2804652 RepID=UPI003CF60FFE